jgi:hypothetical protein
MRDLIERRPGPGSADNERIRRAASVEPRIPGLDLRLHHHRHPDLGAIETFGAVKALRCDAQDGERPAVEHDGTPDDGTVAEKSRAPAVVTQHRDRVRAGHLIVARTEQAAVQRFHAEEVEVVPGREIPPHADGALGPREVHRRDPIGAHRCHGGGAVAQIPIKRKRMSRPTFGFQKEQFVRPLHRQRTHQEGADDAEHQRVRSDAERQREHGDDRESGAALHPPEAIKNVRSKVGEEWFHGGR